jgi:PAS domain S-box-containing protein
MERIPMKNPSNENSCRILVESLNQVLFTLDDRGKITCVSVGCAESLGFLPEEMTGRPLSAFVTPDDNGRIGELCDPANQDMNHPCVFSVVGKDGGLHPASIIPRSIFDGPKKTGMIGIIGEINAGKPTEELFRQANARIHLLNSIVRHDINNQLTVLHGYLSLIEQDQSMVTSPEVVRILLGATDKIHKMVTFTTEYKDIGTHFPVWSNLFEVFQSARSTSPAAGVQITPEPACQELELFCDPMLTKVFHHLIGNSLRHGKTVSGISLRWRQENGGAIIVYEDNGTGIADSVKPTLFQRGNGKKTGYGMFLVHEILAISGFTITETGTPGNGVRFEIVVPAGSFRVVKKKQQ